MVRDGLGRAQLREKKKMMAKTGLKTSAKSLRGRGDDRDRPSLTIRKK